MIEVVLRAAAFVIGIVLVLVFFQSVLRVAVVNRQGADRLALMSARLAYTAVALVASRRRSYERIQDALAWVFPLYFFLLIVTWFLLVQVGFSLMIWSLQAERNILQAFISSGSALSTLGFLTPPSLAGQLLAIPEGAFGLGIVVFFFTFIPGYQSTIQIREMKVAWFYARGGASPTAASFVGWLQRHGNADDMIPMWEDWEMWFRLLIASHSVAPILAVVPSVRRGQSWLVAVAAMLDTVAFWLSALDFRDDGAASVCHATGVEVLKLIVVRHRATPIHAAATSAAAEPFSRGAFDALSDQVAAMGAHLNSDRNAAWRAFITLRHEYEDLLLPLAGSLLVPLDNSVLLPLATKY
jgi:hypothetical protein